MQASAAIKGMLVKRTVWGGSSIRCSIIKDTVTQGLCTVSKLLAQTMRAQTLRPHNDEPAGAGCMLSDTSRSGKHCRQL